MLLSALKRIGADTKWLESLEPRLLMARVDPSPAEDVLFRLPLAADTTKHFYFDRDPATGVATAWNGTSNTYDGHTGSDFSSILRNTPIYAAADGILVTVVDGYGDMQGTANGNYVKINHGNDRNGNPINTFYLHMNAGTPTTRPIGSLIHAGEQIGGVGTSGNSTGLHLHFHVSIAGVALDPFAATGTSEKSWWVNQGSGSPSTTANTSKFVVGDTAEAYELTTSSLNVRGPNPTDASIGSRSNGMRGTVMEGPVYAAFNGDIANSLWVFYKIHWSDGLEGWSVQNWLKKGVDTVAPFVVGSNLMYETAPNKLEVTFSEDVGNSLSGSDFLVKSLTTGQTITPSFSYNASTRKGTLSFAAGLPDGNYRLTISAGSVNDNAGNALASDYTYDFFSLAGDANRSRSVDLTDFTILASNFNQSGKTFSQGNFDYDTNGIVDLTDFTILAANFNKTLAASAPAAAQVATLPNQPASPLFNAHQATIWDVLDPSKEISAAVV
jgi:hypothetical protein